MKRIIYIIILVLFLGIPQAAQAQSLFRFGLKVMPSLGWLSSETDGLTPDGPAMKFGYGLHGEYGFTPRYSFASGIYITGAGASMNFPTGQDSVHYLLDNDKFSLINRKYKLTYVTIPLTLKLRTNEIGYMTYYGQFGLDLNIRAKARATDEVVLAGSTNLLTKDNINIENDISLMKLGLNIGIGAEYTISGTTALVFGLNYRNGFTNILRHKSNMLMEDNGSTFLQKALNHQVSLTVGVIF